MTTRGLYIEQAHANLIHSGSKTLVVKDKFFKLNPNDMALVTTIDKNDTALGMIRLQKPKSITISEFKKYRQFHKISDEDRRKWWPNAQKLWAYQVKQYYGFKDAKIVNMTVVNDIVSDLDLESKRKDTIAEFTADNLTDVQLKSNFRKLCSWHSSKQTRYSKEDITLIGKKLMRELMKRNIKFNKRGMNKTNIKLLEQLTNKDFYMHINHGQESERGSLIKLDEFLKKWDTMKLFESGISLVGSLANHRETTGDIDIVIKAEPDTDLFNLVKWRVMRAYPEYEGRFHFLTDGKFRGNFTSHVDLADIVAVRNKLEVKDMGVESSDGDNYSSALEYELSDVKAMEGFRLIEHTETAEQTATGTASAHTYDLYYANGEYWLADDSIIKWRSFKDVPHEAIEEWHRITGQRLQLEDCAQKDSAYLVLDPDKAYDNAAAYIISDPEKCLWLKEGTHIPVFIAEDKVKEVEGWLLDDIRILKKGKPQDFKGYTIEWDGETVNAVEIKKFADGDKFIVGEAVIYGPMSGGEYKYLPSIIVEDGTGDRAGQVKIKIEGEEIWTDRDNVNKKAGPTKFTKSIIELDFIKPTKPYLDMDAHVSNEFFMMEDMKDFNYTNKIIEKKYDGQRLQIHKNGNSVKCYTAYGNQISLNKLGNIPNEIRAINSYAFILDGELMLPGLDRDYVHEAVTMAGSDSLEYRVFDILQVNDSRLITKPLYHRRRILERLSSSPHVKISPALPVTKDNIADILKQLKDKGYEGAVIKDLNSEYQDGKAWHKFVFISNYLKKTEDMHDMTENEVKDYRITLRRMERKLKEGKRIPVTESILDEQKDMIAKLMTRDFSAPKFILTRNEEDYHLKLECPTGYKFNLDKNPQAEPSISATESDNQISGNTEQLCAGEFELIKEEPGMLEVRFKGKKFSGKYIFKKTTGSKIWAMTKVTKEKHLSAIKMDFKDFRQNTNPILAKDITFPYKRRTIAFAPGFWHHTVYTWDIIKAAAMKMKGIPMVMEHSDEILDDLGNVTEVFINEKDQRIEVEFELIDTVNGKDAAILLENNKIPAVSVSLEEWSDDIDGKNTCTQIMGFGHLALVKYPECAPATICDKDGTCQ